MAHSQNLIGRSLGQYELRELLGRGGIGAVYRAYQASLKREVAVKVLPDSLSEQPDFVERFKREATIAAGLEHPHIVAIHELGLQDSTAYIVMRLMTGLTLTERLRTIRAPDEKPLVSLGESSKLLNQLASALDYAHGEHVIHRDVKPANTLFDNQGNAYLSDFGIAKLSTTTGLTGAGLALGTPEFMAPEQWQDTKLTVPASDQYALAVMVYTLVTGRASFQGDTPFNLMYKHLHEMPTPPHVLRADIPELVSTVLYRAMAKNPYDRFETVTAFAQAFERAIAGAEGNVTGLFSASLPRRSRQGAGISITNSSSKPPMHPLTPRAPIQMMASTVTPVVTVTRNRMPIWMALIALLGILAGIVIAVVILLSVNHPPPFPTIVVLVGTTTAMPNTSAPVPSTQAAATTQIPVTSTSLPSVTSTVSNSSQPNPRTPLPPSVVTLQSSMQSEGAALITTVVPSATHTPLSSSTPSATPTFTPSHTRTPTPSATPTAKPTFTPSATDTRRPSATSTLTPTFTPSHTRTPTPSATSTTKPTFTPLPTNTVRPTATFTLTPTIVPSSTNTPSPSTTITRTLTVTSSRTNTSRLTATPTFTPTQQSTLTATLILASSPTPVSGTASPMPIRSPIPANTLISVTNAAQLKTLRALPKLRGSISGLQFGSDSTFLAFSLSNGADTTVRLYNVGLDQIQVACQASGSQFSLNGTSVVLLNPSSALTVEDTTCQTRSNLKGINASILDITFSPDGKLIATSYADSSVHVWTAATGQMRSVYRVGALVNNLMFSPDGNLLIGTTGDGIVLAWDVITDKPVGSHPTHITKMTGPAAAANGIVAVGGASGTLLLWDAKSGQAGTSFKGHTDTVNGVAFNPDGTLLASGSDDKTVRVWNTATGQELYRQTTMSSVSNVVFSPDGTLLAFSTGDGVIELLSVH
jgi:serine/threonine protein kinase